MFFFKVTHNILVTNETIYNETIFLILHRNQIIWYKYITRTIDLGIWYKLQ